MSKDAVFALTERASVFLTEGKTEQAIEAMENAYAVSVKNWGETHPDTLSVLNDLSVYCGAAGNYEKALDYATRATEGRATVLGDIHPDTLASRHNVAHALFCLGRPLEAIPLAENVLAHRPTGELSTLQAMMNLAACYGSAGRVDEALAMYDDTLKLQIQLLGEKHPDTMTSMRGLVTMYRNIGRLDDSVRLAKRLLVLCNEQFGNTAAVTIEAMQNLALCYTAQGKHTKAVKMLEQALECQNQVLGEGHPETAVTKNSLAVNYISMQQPQKAHALFLEVLAQQTKNFGEEHPAVLDALQNLAFCCAENNRTEEALSHYRRLWRLKEIVFGTEAETTLQTMQDVAMQMLIGGQKDKGFALAKDVLERTEKSSGVGSAAALAAAEMLADCYRSDHRHDLAIDVLKTSLSRKGDKESGPETVHSMLKLAAVYYDTAQFEEGWKLAERAAAIALSTLGENHPGTINALNILYSSCMQLGKLEQAKDAAEHCLSLREANLGPAHRDTITTLQHVADICHKLGDAPRAVALLREVVDRLHSVGEKNEVEWNLVWHNMAYYAFCAEDYLAAEEAGRAMWELALKRGEQTWDGALALQIIADAQNGAGHYAEARRNAERALSIAKETASKENGISQFYCTLADACFGMGDNDAARAAAEESVRLCEAAFGPESQRAKDTRRFAEKFR